MFMMIYPKLCWLIAMDTMGLSWITGTSQKRTSQSAKEGSLAPPISKG